MQDQYFGGNYVRKLHFTNVLTGIKVEMRAAGQFGTSHPPCIIDINAGDKGGGGRGVRHLHTVFTLIIFCFLLADITPGLKIFQFQKWIHYHPQV